MDDSTFSNDRMPIEYWRRSDGQTIHVDFIKPNHALNIVLMLSEWGMLDCMKHAPLIEKAHSWRVFGPYAKLARWWHRRRRKKVLEERVKSLYESFRKDDQRDDPALD